MGAVILALPPNQPGMWVRSSVGRARESHSRGQGFESPRIHQIALGLLRWPAPKEPPPSSASTHSPANGVVDASFPGSSPGRATFEWALGRQLLIQHTTAPRPAPDSIAIISVDPKTAAYTQHSSTREALFVSTR